MKRYDALRLILTTSLTDREIGASAGVSKTTVGRYRQLAEAKQLSWDKLAELGPDGIDSVVNRPRSGGKAKRIPDLSLLHDQLQAKSMTLQLLWEEMRNADPHTTPSYSHLAACLKRYRSTLPTVMRQRHVPGERVFVDYSGLRPFYIDRTTQEKVFVELFVAVLGASSLMFAMCTPSQKVPDFIRAHVEMLNYFGGVPMVVVPDNLKSAVVVAGRSPQIQRSYADFARHYALAILPARPYRPRDKGSVEVGVKFAQQRVLARLRHQQFFSLDELNAEIARLLEDVNARAMVKDGLSRRARFEAIERTALRPLPALPYLYADWTAVPKVPQDYHVAVEGHFYSVPHDLIGKRVDARLTDATVEILHNRRRVALHKRSSAVGSHTTAIAHQPEAHRAQGDRTPEGMLAWDPTCFALFNISWGALSPSLDFRPVSGCVRWLGRTAPPPSIRPPVQRSTLGHRTSLRSNAFSTTPQCRQRRPPLPAAPTPKARAITYTQRRFHVERGHDGIVRVETRPHG